MTTSDPRPLNQWATFCESSLLHGIQRARDAGFDHLAQGLANLLRSQIARATVQAAIGAQEVVSK